MKSIEVRFNDALEALKKVGKQQKFEEKRTLRMSIEAQLNLAETILKEAHVIRNDSAELFVESVSEGYGRKVTDLRELQIKSYQAMGLTEAEARKVLGLAPKEVQELGGSAVSDYFMGQSMRFSEAECIRLAKKGR